MTGFWSTETLQFRIPNEGLIDPYEPGLIENCSYELRLGAEVYVTGDDAKTKRELLHGQQVRIPPGQFANLLTEEMVRVPADSLGFLSAKFRWKQRGLVNVSGFHVDPGYHGRILFSVFNAGPTPVVVERGDPLFLLWYCSLDRETADVYARPPRISITSEDVSHLQGDVATPQALALRVENLEQTIRTTRKVFWWVVTVFVAAVVAALIGVGVNAAFAGDGNDNDPTAPGTATTIPTTVSAPGGVSTQPTGATTTVQGP